MDAFLTDAVCDPPGAGHERYFTEELVRLPSQFCYVPPAHLPASEGTPARRRGYIVFGVFNQYRKFTDEMLSVWREIMDRVPASRLLLKSQVFFAGEMRAAAEERLRRLGFDLERVLLEPADTGYMRRGAVRALAVRSSRTSGSQSLRQWARRTISLSPPHLRAISIRLTTCIEVCAG